MSLKSNTIEEIYHFEFPQFAKYLKKTFIIQGQMWSKLNNNKVLCLITEFSIVSMALDAPMVVMGII